MNQFASMVENLASMLPTVARLTLNAGELLAIERGSELWIFVDITAETKEDYSVKLKHILSIQVPETISLVRVVMPRLPEGASGFRLKLGFEAMGFQSALHKILELPAAFAESQRAFTNEALSPVDLIRGGPVKMRAILAADRVHEDDDASALLASWLTGGVQDGGSHLVFVEAEAGKGKTVLLASLAREMQRNSSGPVPIYVPLRRLPLGSGVSWENVMQVIGVVGAGSALVASAVRHGLVVLLLDGIDEVSGRYDGGIIRELLTLIESKVLGKLSRVVLSGRKTEARVLDPGRWTVVGIDLPEASTDDFRRYVRFVVTSLESEWNERIANITDFYSELLGRNGIDEQVVREREYIVEWIVAVFPSVGKDTSLFFVQGLAAIAFGRRAGNRFPLKAGNHWYVPSVSDVCSAAVIFACLREQGKIEGFARGTYVAEKQVDVLKGFALLASASLPENLPTPNEVAQDVFAVDTVNNSEVWLAILRQNAKHALLYASETAGAYRPQFLSDWIRCSLLADVLVERGGGGKIGRSRIPTLVLSADRARYTFGFLLPDRLGEQSLPKEWAEELAELIGRGNENASANFWQLRGALGDSRLPFFPSKPLPLAQIDHARFAGAAIGPELSGEDFFLDDSEFEGCVIDGAVLHGVSMNGVVFRNCVLRRVEIAECEGSILFDGCTLDECVIRNVKSFGIPSTIFVRCRFGEKCRIEQTKPAYGPSRIEPAVNFVDCKTVNPVTELLEGEWLNLPANFSGLLTISAKREVEPAVECLREVLATFFPTRMGSEGSIQSRDYIRLSALGRGRLPAGAPGQSDLQVILESVGFATGGRSDHLYAPWAEVIGGGERERGVRNELIDFMRDTEVRGDTVEALLRKLRKRFS